MTEELWKPIPGFDNYEVSDLGNVRSWWRRGYGDNRVADKPHLLKPTGRGPKRNYLAVMLGQNRSAYVAHLVLYAFVGPRPSGMEACHNDGNPSNNCLDNLRWDTHRNNEQDKLMHGTAKRGESCNWHKLTEVDIIKIREMSMSGTPHKEIADIFGVNRTAIQRITYGVRWPNAAGPIHTKDSPYRSNEPRPNYLVEHPELSVGESNGRALLTENDVRDIRSLLVAGERQKDIAAIYGVKTGAISAIATGRNWKHVK